MSDNKDLISLIKSQVDKATTLFSEKDIIEVEIKEIFASIKDAMKGEISFLFEKELDRYGDAVTTVYASNQYIMSKYTVITYDFDNQTVLPVKISDIDSIPQLCWNLDDVKSTLANMISNDGFMIRLVAISKERDNNSIGLDDDIPF